jgi:hypothetical protein
MKNISTGFGLALLSGAIVTHTLVTNLASTANASAVTATASAVSTAATAQAGPTIVWYGVVSPASGQPAVTQGVVFRAWSDGRVEYKIFNPQTQYNQCTFPGLTCGWQLFSDPAQGLTYRSDINFDAKVDGADLGQLLADWGDAPRQDIPPSDCPLALINP